MKTYKFKKIKFKNQRPFYRSMKGKLIFTSVWIPSATYVALKSISFLGLGATAFFEDLL